MIFRENNKVFKSGRNFENLFRNISSNKDASTIKAAGKRALVFLISTALALAAAELIFRAYEKRSTSALFIDDKDQVGQVNLGRFKYKPHEIVFESRCNSQGYFDDQEFIIAKKLGVRRVVAISDSFGCVRVPVKYHAFTKAEKLEGEGNRWEIYNLSRNGINNEAYLYILKEFDFQKH